MRQLKPATMRRLLTPNLGGSLGLPATQYSPNPIKGQPMVVTIHITATGLCVVGTPAQLANMVRFAKKTRKLPANFFNGG